MEEALLGVQMEELDEEGMSAARAAPMSVSDQALSTMHSDTSRLAPMPGGAENVKEEVEVWNGPMRTEEMSRKGTSTMLATAALVSVISVPPACGTSSDGDTESRMGREE